MFSHWEKSNPHINCSSFEAGWIIMGFYDIILCVFIMIGLWSDPWCCLTCHSVVYEIKSDIFPGFRTGNFLFELTSCYRVQVIFTVFARIKLQLQTLLRLCQPAGRLGDGCQSRNLSSSPVPWLVLVGGWQQQEQQHRARLASAWIFKTLQSGPS